MPEYKFVGSKVSIDDDVILVSTLGLKEELKMVEIVYLSIEEPGRKPGKLTMQTAEKKKDIAFIEKTSEAAHSMYNHIIEVRPELENSTPPEKKKPDPLPSPEPKRKNTLECPHCKGTNLQVMGNDRKAFSVGKAVGGAVLTGGIGTLAGFAGKKGKYEMLCIDCGQRFKVK